MANAHSLAHLPPLRRLRATSAEKREAVELRDGGRERASASSVVERAKRCRWLQWILKPGNGISSGEHHVA